MKRRQLQPGHEIRNALSVTTGESVVYRDQCIWAQPSRRFEGAIEIVRASHVQGLHLYPQCSPAILRLLEDERGIRIGRIPKHCHATAEAEALSTLLVASHPGPAP